MKVKDSINMGNLWKDVKTSLKKMSDHLVVSAASASMDALLILFAAGFTLSSFFRSIYDDALSILHFYTEHRAGASTEELLEIIPSQEALYGMVGNIVFNATIFFVIIWVLWVLMQSVSWHLVYRVGEHQKGPMLKNYMKRFALSSIPLFVFSYISLAVFALMVLSPIVFGAIRQSILIVNVISFLSMIYLYVFFVLFLLLSSLTYASIFHKKGSAKSYKKEVFMVFKRKRFFIMAGFTLLMLALFILSDNILPLLQEFPFVLYFVDAVVKFGLIILFKMVIISQHERMTGHHNE